jgi:hypothetical protein
LETHDSRMAKVIRPLGVPRQERARIAATNPYQAAPQLPSPPTLRGVPLEPGERVVYFHHTKNVGTRVLMFFMGIGLAAILIGFLFLWLAFTDQSETTAITTRRFIRIHGKKPAEVMGLGDIARKESVYGLRARRTGARLHDAGGRCVSLSFTSDEKLRPLVDEILKDARAVESLPTVPHDA